MNKISLDLFQGDVRDALEASRERSVNWIVYVGQDLPSELAFHSRVPVIHVPLADGTDCIEKWRVCAKIVGLCLQSGQTLVACRAGLSRSPAMILYYLLRTGGLKDFEAVYRFVERKVPEFYPVQDIINMIKGELCLAVY